jgi:hypothetical protein
MKGGHETVTADFDPNDGRKRSLRMTDKAAGCINDLVNGVVSACRLPVQRDMQPDVFVDQCRLRTTSFSPPDGPELDRLTQ